MALLVNLRDLSEEPVSLSGRLTAEELDLGMDDCLVHARRPLDYRLSVSREATGLLVQGSLEMVLDCECRRCLRPFSLRVQLPRWSSFLPFQGEEAAVVNGDFVDLTPYIREDILLAFPQDPICGADCPGPPQSGEPPPSSPQAGADQSGVWAELNKLNLEF